MNDAPNIIDCSQLNPMELAEKLRLLPDEVHVQLVDYRPQLGETGLCSGLSKGKSIEVVGSVGDCCFFMGNGAHLDIQGNAGESLGHSMNSGEVTVHGNAGHSLAAFACGGFIAVLGQAGERCGQGMCGADLFVRSRVGRQAAYGMRSGTLVLGNGTGEGLGEGMTGGEVYVRGEVLSKANSLRQERMRDADALRLTLFLARAGIKASPGDFKVFRPKPEPSLVTGNQLTRGTES